MIVVETIGNKIHTYSDAGYTIIQVDTGIEYGDAWDVVKHTYEETSTKLDEEKNDD